MFTRKDLVEAALFIPIIGIGAGIISYLFLAVMSAI